jgi:hypothetical protein
MNVTTLAAVVYTVVTAGAVAFQVALALGVPWGSYAMGGRFPGRFPPTLRVAAAVQATLLGLMAAVVLSRVGLALPGWSRAATWLIWAVVAFSVISLGLNAATPSGGERRIWVPVALVLLASSLTVALTWR